MYKGNEIAYATGEGWGRNSSESNTSPTFLLTLPTLDLRVPFKYRQAAHPSIVQFARQLGLIDVLTEADIVDEPSIDGAIKHVLGREISSSLGSLELFTLTIDIKDGCIDGYYDEEDGQALRCTSETDRIFFSVSFADMPTVTIGEKLKNLEAIKEGLGQTVYSVLKLLSEGSFPLFTFDSLFEFMPWLYGLDEESEENAEDENEGNLTKEKLLDGTVFKWAIDSQILLTPTQVEMVLHDPSTPKWASDILVSTLNASKAYEVGKGQLGVVELHDVDPAYHLGYVRFFANDQMGRIMDDLFEAMNSCADNYTTMSHFEMVDLRDTHEFKKWWSGILAGMRLVSSIDALLHSLSGNSHKEK